MYTYRISVKSNFADIEGTFSQEEPLTATPCRMKAKSWATLSPSSVSRKKSSEETRHD